MCDTLIHTLNTEDKCSERVKGDLLLGYSVDDFMFVDITMQKKQEKNCRDFYF